jgi:transcriptional regulator with XRE-family HTH domain
MTIVEITGGMLRAARSLAGLSQQELAERASSSRPCLTAWEGSSGSVPNAKARALHRVVSALEAEGRLFFRHGHLACKDCYGIQYASRQRDHNGRKRLAASKLRLQLGGLPDITEPLPAKPKWTRRRTYQRITQQIRALEAKAKTQRFRKPLSTQLFAYHIA